MFSHLQQAHIHRSSIASTRYLHQLWRRRFQSTSSIPAARSRSRVPKSLVSDEKPADEAYVKRLSLKDTLDEHRLANRSGLAVNGIPVRSKPSSTLSVTRSASYRNPTKAFRPSLSCRPLEALAVPKPAPLKAKWRDTKGLSRRLREPWITHLNHQAGHRPTTVTARQRLSQELNACAAYLSPNEAEEAAAEKAFKVISSLITAHGKITSTSTVLIGSRSTGTFNASSDIDINLTLPTTHEDLRKEGLKMLRSLFKYIRYDKTCLNAGLEARAVVSNARVPLLVCEHSPTGLEVQLQCSESMPEVISMVQASIAQFPNLPILLRAVKQMLDMRELSQGLCRGVTSYPLFHMILASLKIRTAANSDPGSQLLEFLDFYSDLDPARHTIVYDTQSKIKFHSPDTIHTPSLTFNLDPLSAQPRLVRRARDDVSDSTLLSLQDPLDVENDLGRGIVMFDRIQATFRQIRGCLRHAMRNWDETISREARMQGFGPSILACCLEGNYVEYELQRQRIREFGEQAVSAP